MHGTIFAELKKYVDTKLGANAWNSLLTAAGLGPRMYVAVQAYPDEEMIKLVTAASEKTGLPAAAILEDFGEFIAPDLLAMYRSLIKPDWKTVEVVEHTESTIHRVVRMQHADAVPPHLHAERNGPRQVTVMYNSPRRLCAVAKGIIRGLAVHFGEVVTLDETRCMHKGAPECVLVITSETAA